MLLLAQYFTQRRKATTEAAKKELKVRHYLFTRIQQFGMSAEKSELELDAEALGYILGQYFSYRPRLRSESLHGLAQLLTVFIL